MGIKESTMSESFGMWLTRLFISQPKKIDCVCKLAKLTKLELEAKGREFGIELDRRKSKGKLINQLKKAMKSYG
jgi:hypothetical protein